MCRLFHFNTFEMVTVYVLISEKDNARYTGMCTNLERRLSEHNSGKNRYTKGHIPWNLLYTEQQPDWETARKREKYLKSAAGRKWLDNLLKT